METRERNSINYYNPPQSNQDSSPILTTAPSISSPASNTRRNQTLNHHHHQGNGNNYIHGFKLLKDKLEPETTRRNPNPDPNTAILIFPTPTRPQRPPSTTIRPVVRYRECLKNHAANMGSHVVDGCGEFMPGGEDDTPQALKCAACECHRSFHRREVEGESRSNNNTFYMAPRPPPRATTVHPPPAMSTQQLHRRNHQPMPPIMLAFGGGNGAPAESSSEDFNIFQTYARGQTSKKRFRTKFTQEQKEKMLDFAKTIGWKIQKQDEEDVLKFCNEVGLKKQVFKVWMHNNKHGDKKI